MTPTEYEHYVAAVLAAEGWDARVTPPQRDFGLDVICEREGRRLGVQVKMYGSGERPVNAQIIMQLHGAAAYQDCTEAMLVTDGRVLDDARRVGRKLDIELRHMPIPGPDAFSDRPVDATSGAGWTFDAIWEEHVVALVGRSLTRPNGDTNEILSVDWGGLKRRTSNGKTQRIDIEIFRWVIDRLLSGETVLRDEINDQCINRSSSGIVLIVGSLPMFETVKVGRKSGLRLRVES